MPKFKKGRKNAVEKELGNSKSESIIEYIMPKAGVPDDIDVETNQDAHFFSKNMAVTVEGNLQTDEDLRRQTKNELTAVISEGIEKGEDSVSDAATSKNASLFPHQSDSSCSSTLSQSPFMIFKSKTFMPEFNFDMLKEVGSESFMDWDVTDDRMTAQACDGKIRSVTTSKHFDNNHVKKNCNESLVEDQDGVFSPSLGENEIRELREALEKYLMNYLKKFKNEAFKREQLHQKEDNWPPISDRNASKCKHNEKVINVSTPTLPTSNNFRNKSIVNLKPRTVPKVRLTCAQSSRSIRMKPSNTEQHCDSCDGNCLPSTTVHWGLDTYEIQEKTNSPGQVHNAAKNHPFNNCVALSGKSNKVKQNKKEEYFGKRNKKSKKIHKTGSIENLGICQIDESDEEYDCKQNNKSKWKKRPKIDRSVEKRCSEKNKVSKLKAIRKVSGNENLYIRHSEESVEHTDESDESCSHKRNKKSNSKKVRDESDKEYCSKRRKKSKSKNSYKTGKMEYLKISYSDESDESEYDRRNKSKKTRKTGGIGNCFNYKFEKPRIEKVNEEAIIYVILVLICFIFLYYFFS